MAETKLTPAKRALLMLMIKQDLLVTNVTQRWLWYLIDGQIHHKISRKNFERMCRYGWIEAVPSQQRAVYRLTPQAISHLKGDYNE